MGAVNHPQHYNFGKYEVIDVIDDWKLGFPLGNAIKYIARAGKKDPGKKIEDLEKAAFYINHEIKRLQSLETSVEAKAQENDYIGLNYKGHDIRLYLRNGIYRVYSPHCAICSLCRYCENDGDAEPCISCAHACGDNENFVLSGEFMEECE